ncbi:MAG: hypothetical protein ABIG66_02380 [Candidatus Kerfeldbacteria bacterium]
MTAVYRGILSLLSSVIDQFKSFRDEDIGVAIRALIAEKMMMSVVRPRRYAMYGDLFRTLDRMSDAEIGFAVRTMMTASKVLLSEIRSAGGTEEDILRMFFDYRLIERIATTVVNFADEMEHGNAGPQSPFAEGGACGRQKSRPRKPRLKVLAPATRLRSTVFPDLFRPSEQKTFAAALHEAGVRMEPGSMVSEQQFPLNVGNTCRGDAPYQMALVEFDRSLNFEAMLAALRRQGLARPTLGDALFFMRRYRTHATGEVLVPCERWEGSHGDAYVPFFVPDDDGREWTIKYWNIAREIENGVQVLARSPAECAEDVN